MYAVLMLGVVWTKPDGDGGDGEMVGGEGDEGDEGDEANDEGRALDWPGRVAWIGWAAAGRRADGQTGRRADRQTGGGAGAHHRPCRQAKAETAVGQPK